MAESIRRVTVVVLDSVGCGDAPGAAPFGDAITNALTNVVRAVGSLSLPSRGALGLGNLTDIPGPPSAARSLVLLSAGRVRLCARSSAKILAWLHRARQFWMRSKRREWT